jgi:hypothetical protein
MARPLRTEFPGAIYHVMSRGNARQVVFRDGLDYQRMIGGLAQVVDRFGLLRNLIRRGDGALSSSSSVRKDVATLRDRLLKTVNRA